MKNFIYILLLTIPLMLSGCSPIGDKSTSMSVIYLVTAILSFLLFVGYFVLIRKKCAWFVVLYSSVFIVNTGYWLLSVCKTIDAALFANRLSYLGSVFLPMSILMIILNVTNSRYKKWLPFLLSAISVVMFFITASYPYLDVYYKAVTIKYINGVCVLSKVYGNWHVLYLIFLLAYFAAIIAVTIHSSAKKKLASKAQSIVMTIAAFVNICVWLLEQLVNIDFEFLSVSYIISELFLLGLYIAIEDTSSSVQTISPEEDTPSPAEEPPAEELRLSFFAENLPRLTPAEHRIYEYYIEGKSTKEIMELLNIKENTLKYHNRNIYSKLGVSSRKELVYFAKML